jgi:hypothetical protein
MWFRTAEGLYDETGLRPMRRPWRSLFAGRQNVSGGPGVQNVRDDDLRRVQTSWAGGEGQAVVDPTDQQTFRKYDRSLAIDASIPGQLRLARAMSQQGFTGAGSITNEADTWVDDIGTSTVVGTDRRLNAVADAIKKDTAVLGAGNWQFDFYGYEDAPPVTEGSDFRLGGGQGAVAGSDFALKSSDAWCKLTGQDPIDGQVTLKATFVPVIGSGPGIGIGSIQLSVKNESNQNIVAQATSDQVRAPNSGDVSVTFTAQAGKTYFYRVDAKHFENLSKILVDKITIDESDTRTLLCEVKQGVTVVGSQTVSTAGTTSSQKLTSITILSPGATVYTTRVTRSGAGTSRKPWVDKEVHVQVSMNDPRTIELGFGDRIWLVDYSTGTQPQGFYWDPANNRWTNIAVFATAGKKAIAMAHSDNFEFVVLDDKIVYHMTTAAIAAHTTATTDDTVGLAVGGNRLYILTEATATGTTLLQHPLEGAPAAPTSVYAVGNLGMNPDTDLPQRMTGTKTGVVFFANQGPDCWVYAYDGAAGFPVVKLPTGFRGRAISHGLGFTWVSGSFPTVDATGTNHRPAIFLVDHSNSTAEELDLTLYRSDDPSTKIRMAQMYGSDLWLVAEVQTTPKKMRLWRVSLRAPIAAFLEQEITTDDTQQSVDSRGLAITHRDRFAVWAKGGPYLQSQTAYQTSGTAFLRGSRYDYGLAESKELLSFGVEADIPAGTSIEVWYSTDGATFAVAGTWTAQGIKAVSLPDVHVFFTTLQVEIRLLSTSSAITPTLYALQERMYLQKYDKGWDLLLTCFDPSAAWHMDGSEVPGQVAADYLFSLADGAGVVEFEDRYSWGSEANQAPIYTVHVETPDQFFVARGESYLRVHLTDRAA